MKPSRLQPTTPALAGVVLSALLLVGCAAPPQLAALRHEWPAALPARVQVAGVPFYVIDGEGQSLGGHRIGAMLRPFGQRLDKISEARSGELVALAKVEALSADEGGAKHYLIDGAAPLAGWCPATRRVWSTTTASRCPLAKWASSR